MNRTGRPPSLRQLGDYLSGEDQAEWEWPLIKACALWLLLWLMTAAV